MLDNLILLVVIVSVVVLLLCVASIVYQAWLKARYEREIRERMRQRKAYEDTLWRSIWQQSAIGRTFSTAQRSTDMQEHLPPWPDAFTEGRRHLDQ